MNLGYSHPQTLMDLTVLDYESFFDDDDTTSMLPYNTEKLMMTSHSGDTVSPRDGSSSNSNFSDGPHHESGPTRKAPIRRRIKASKKARTNTTFLKVNPSNFRAVVQKHTGRNSGYPLRRRGPINLNFAKYKNHRYHRESTKPSSSSADRCNSLLVVERSDDRRSFFYSSACSTNDVSVSPVVSGITNTVLENPRPDPFALVDGLDDICMQNFPLPEFSGSDDDDDDDYDRGCHDLLIGDDFWG